MRVKLFFSFLILASLGNAFAVPDVEEIKIRIAQFERMQELVSKNCLPNPESKKNIVEIEGEKFNCAELVLLTDQLKIEIDNEVKELEKLCDDEEEHSAHKDLALQTGKIIESSPSCKVSPDKDSCSKAISCSVIGVLPSLKEFFTGKIINSPEARECRNLGNNCMAKIFKGVIDSIWTNLTGLWDLGKMAVVKTGELLGIVKASENKTSESAMAAQQASPGFLEQLKKDPFGTLSALGSNLFDAIQSAAINHYGCEKWSGIPFNSECLAPMSTWDCATCAQKTQVWCGVGGYALGEIPTALLTGGIFAVGKIALTGAFKLSGSAASNVASFIGKTFPKSSSVAANAGKKLGAFASRSWSALARGSVTSWNNIANSKTTSMISEAAKALSKTDFGKGVSLLGSGIGSTASVAGKILTHKYNPLAMYVRALDKAFMKGFNAVNGLAVGATAASKLQTYTAFAREEMTKEAYLGSKLADEALGLKSPSITIAKDQSKATPGMVILDTPKFSLKNPAYTPKGMGKINKSEEVGARLGVVDTDVPALITKFRKEPEYAKLFATRPYPGYHDDLAAVISHMEKTQPQLSKADIKQTIDKVMNSCDLK